MIRIGGAPGMVDKPLAVRKDADDFKAQPPGDSDAPIACRIVKS